jgi:radical SAM superfamily enzyme YgiQ (UPF0313 family)
MPDILLATLNAKYPHAAFGLRYLLANLPPHLGARAALLEFDINQRPTDILEAILAQNPRIVGLGIYIWNAAQSTQLAADLKRLRPDIMLVLGGPEISYETDQQQIAQYADHIVTGEADMVFGELCERLLDGERPLAKVIAAELPEFAIKGSGFRVQGSGQGASGHSTQDSALSSLNPEPRTLNPQRPLALPYHLYTDDDLRNRVIYVEASRGCPFKCEFCLSSLDVPVRNVPLDAFLASMQTLLDRGLQQFKFVDRTFNLNLNISKAILQFFLDRYRPGLFLHFEMIPDRLPEALRTLIQQFPPGALQFEVGIQTFNEDVAALISRKQDNAKLEDNLRFLRTQTGVHIHTDLIVGLPGEDVESFAAGFDRLVALNPQEIQVGILKRLRGTPIVRHDKEWEMIYSPNPPYEILQTKLIDFATMQRLRRFARYWDLIANSGNFRDTLRMLWTSTNANHAGLGAPSDDPDSSTSSSFHTFLTLSEALYEKMGRNHGIALQDLAQFLFNHLTSHIAHPPDRVANLLWQDYQRCGRSDRPAFLRPFIGDQPVPRRPRQMHVTRPRQARHMT